MDKSSSNDLSFWPLSKSRRYILFPTLQNLISDKKRNSVVDIGCAEGDLCMILAKDPAIHSICGIDISSTLIKNAEEKKKLLSLSEYNKISYIMGDALQLLPLSKPVDIIILAHILCMSKNLEELATYFKITYDSLCSSGTLLISVPHPAFDNITSKSLQRIYHEPYTYFSRDNKCSTSYTQEGHSIHLEDYHYTLSDYINSALSMGFNLEQIIEPQPPLKIATLDRSWFDKQMATPTMIVFSFRRNY